MTLHEPATLATDYLLAALAGWLAWRLRATQWADAENRSRRWWARALVLTTASALVGGSYHGFAPNWPALMRPWWTLTLAIVCGIGAAMDLACLHETTPQRGRPAWRGVIGLKLALFAAIAVAHPKFLVAMLAYGLSLMVWLIAAVTTARPWRVPILTAIGLSVMGGAVQQLRLAPTAWFNHNDLYHVLQAFALLGFYRAARLMGPGASISQS